MTISHSRTAPLLAFDNQAMITLLMEALMPAGNEQDLLWKQKLNALRHGLLYALCYKQARDNVRVTPQIIQSSLPLPRFVELYREALAQEWEEAGYKPMEDYLVNLPGFDIKQINTPAAWSQVTLNQHGFLIQQLTLQAENNKG